MKWYFFPKDVLPNVLLSSHHPERLGGVLVEHPSINATDIILGYCDDIYHQPNYTPPAIIALPENKSAEIMAWLKTYAPDTFPLSQFARVLKPMELKQYESNSIKKTKHNFHFNRWSSVILGEILAQGEIDISLDTLPLSRGQATYSHTIARVNACYGGNQYKELCIDRLKLTETDKNLVSRTLTIPDLEPIWENIDIDLNDVNDITHIFAEFNRIDETYLGRQSTLIDLKTQKELFGDSIESRVLAFRQIVTEEFRYGTKAPSKNAAIKIAIAAFLVGKGTSHIFLLKQVSKDLPAVYPWFGLIAGIVGPTCWEVDWARAAKGIEKSLRAKFDWSEPNQSDLSWSEYDWLSETFRNTSPFVSLPKLLPRVLSIEIIPGAACQFRLATDNAVALNKNQSNDIVMHELTALRALLSEFYSLADKVKEKINETKEINGSTNPSKTKNRQYTNKKTK